MAGLGRTITLLAQASKTGYLRAAQQPKILRSTRSFGNNPGGLTMLSHTPHGLPPNPALVVVLHGCTQTAEGYARGAGWIEASDRYGFALLCPEQSAANNPNVCFNWFNPGDTARGRGEAASIAHMIETAITTHAIDPRRVFITGLSAGGAMANVLLASYPELFAAGAIIAGLPYGSASNVQEAFTAMARQPYQSAQQLGDKVRSASSHAGPWPRISVWHGDSDATVSPSAGDAIVRQWVNVHEIVSEPESGGGLRAWRSDGDEIIVQHRRITGMGHGTPLDTRADQPLGHAGPYLIDVGISSTLEILESWGLVANKAPAKATTIASPHVELFTPVAAAPRPAALYPAGHAPSSKLRSGAKAPIDVGEVINQALRAAGLMK